MEREVQLDLGQNSYRITIVPGLLNNLVQYVRPLLARPYCAIVTDSNVFTHHGRAAVQQLEDAGIATHLIDIPPGESSKSFAILEKVVNRLLHVGIERNDSIIALGGGVVGDLTGFASAILRRGCPFIQIPTTLLAQVDSSVGGKTAINSELGKNMIGAFKQPQAVLIDPDSLNSLSRRQLLCGYAEVVKAALVKDKVFFDWLEGRGSTILAGDQEALVDMIARACEIKADIVSQDETERRGLRALLNLGHTFGHALESECGYSDRLLHGEAVSIGIVLAFGYAQRIGRCPSEDHDRVVAHLRQVELPTHLPHIFSDRCETAAAANQVADRLIKHMQQDKKANQGQIPFILPTEIGTCQSVFDVDLSDIQNYLCEMMQPKQTV